MHVIQNAPKTSVSVLSDSRLLRDALADWLQRQDEIQWVAVAASTHQLLKQLGGRTADVLLVHAKADGTLGRHLVFDVRTLFPAAHLIVLQSQLGAQDMIPWREAGAMDYLQHDSSPAQLIRCIRDAARGRPRSSVAGHLCLTGSFYRGIWTSAHGDGCAVTASDNQRDTEPHLRPSAAIQRETHPRNRHLSLSTIDSSPTAIRQHSRRAAGAMPCGQVARLRYSVLKAASNTDI